MASDSTPVARPTIAPAAAAIIAAHSGTYGGAFELMFVAYFDVVRNCVVAPTLAMRGNRKSVLAPMHVFPYGSIALHTHPSGITIEPSDADIDAAHEFARIGVGFGICSADARELFVVSTPDMVALAQPSVSEAHAAAQEWAVGRLKLTLFRKSRFAQLSYTY